MQYAVCQILGRQYIVKPGAVFEVDKISGDRLVVNEVLLMVDDGRIQIGNPYLKTSLDFEVVSQEREKIRVAKYKAKANYRRVHGSVKQTSKIRLVEKKVETKAKKEGVVKE